MTTQTDETSSLANLILGNAVSHSILTSNTDTVQLGLIKGINPSGSAGVHHSTIQFGTDGVWSYKANEYESHPSQITLSTTRTGTSQVPQVGFRLDSNQQIKFPFYNTNGLATEGGFRFISSSEFAYNLGVDTSGNVILKGAGS